MKAFLVAVVFFLTTIPVVATDKPSIWCAIDQIKTNEVNGTCSIRWNQHIAKSDIKWDFRGNVETQDTSEFMIRSDEFGKSITVRSYAWDGAKIRRSKIFICWDTTEKILVHHEVLGGRTFTVKLDGVSGDSSDYNGACFAEGE